MLTVGMLAGAMSSSVEHVEQGQHVTAGRAQLLATPGGVGGRI
jgi:hypothetical protein